MARFLRSYGKSRLSPPAVIPSITYVGARGTAASVAFGNTLAVTTNATIASAGFITLNIGYHESLLGVSSVSGGGLVWAEAVDVFVGPGYSQWYAYAPTGVTNGTTFTITFGASGGVFRCASIDVFSGIAAVPLDKTASNTSFGAGWNSGTTAVTTVPVELCVAGVATQGGPATTTNPTGYTPASSYISGTNGSVSVFYKIVSATGTQIATGGGWASAIAYAGGIATFKAAVAAPVSTSIRTYLSVDTGAARRVSRPKIFAPLRAVGPSASITTAIIVALTAPRGRTARRWPRSHLYTPAVAPTVAAVFRGPQVALVRVPRHTTRYGLGAPKTILPLPTQQAQTVQVRLSGVLGRVEPRRRPTSRLLPPAVAPAVSIFSGPKTWSVAVQRARTVRATGGGIGSPQVILPLPDLRARTVLVSRARFFRRPTHFRLAPPATLEPESVQLDEETINVTLAWKARTDLVRRAPRSHLDPPQFYPATSTIRVVLAEYFRRGPHSRLSPPLVVLRTFAGPSVTLPAGRSRVARLRTTRSTLPSVPVVAAVTAQPILVHLVRRPVQRQPLTRVTPPTTLQVFTGPKVTSVRVARTVRVTGGGIGSPQVVAPAALARSITVSLTAVSSRLVQRRPIAGLRAPLVSPAVVFAGPEVALAVRARTARSAPPHSTLRPPVVLQVFSGPTVALTRLSRRRVRSELSPAVVVIVPSVEQQEETIRVVLAGRTRVELSRRAPRTHLAAPIFYPVTSSISVTLARRVQAARRATARLTAPTALQTFTGPQVYRARAARPQAHSKLSKPQVVVVPSVEQQEETVRVTLAWRTRVEVVRRAPHPRLSPPQFYPATSVISVTLAGRTRASLARRAVWTRLAPPTVTQTFAGPQVALTRFVRRPVHSRLAAPQFYPSTSTIETTLAGRTRTEVQRRRTHWFLRSPTVTIVPSVEQAEETIRIVLARSSRRRGTVHLGAPAALQVFYGPMVVRAPRVRSQIHSKLGKPTVLIVPSVEQAEETIRVVLAWRARADLVRRAPRSRLSPPVFYPATSSITVALAKPSRRTIHSRLSPPFFYAATSSIKTILGGRTRIEAQRRRSKWFLTPPTVLRVPQVEQQENTIKVVLAPKTRRRTLSLLLPPVVLQVFDGPRVYRTRFFRRPVHSRLLPPTAVLIPFVEQQEETIRVVLARTPRRRPSSHLSAPTVLQTFTGPAVYRTRSARPRTRSKLSPPFFYPSTSAIRVTLAGRTRTTLVRRPTRYGLGAPKVIGAAVPTDRQQAITVWLAGRTRSELSRRTAGGAVGAPQVIEPRALSVRPLVFLARSVRRAVRSRLAPPTTLATFDGPRVTLVRATRRRTYSKFAGPVVAAIESARRITVALASRVPRRPTVYGLRPPLVRAAQPLLQQQTLVVRLVRDRPPRVHSRLSPPVTYSATSTIRVALVRTRPRPTRVVLAPPTLLQTFSGPATVTSAPRTQDVRRQPRSFLSPPAVVSVTIQGQQTITVALAPARRPSTRSRLAPPIFYAATSQILTVLAVGRSRITTVRRLPHVQVRPPQVLSYFFGPAVYLTRLARIRLRVRSALKPQPPGRAYITPPLIVSLAPARRPITASQVFPPTATTPPPEIRVRPTPVYCVAVADRSGRVRRAPHSVVRPTPPGKHLGVACLIDLPAALGCLVDAAGSAACLNDARATVACLADLRAAITCLVDQAATRACLKDVPEAVACLADEPAATACAEDENATAPCLDDLHEAEAILEEEEGT